MGQIVVAMLMGACSKDKVKYVIKHLTRSRYDCVYD